MSGVFVIHPRSKALSDITINFRGEAGPYYFVLADWQESERIKIVYAIGRDEGGVSSVSASITPITIMIGIAGNSDDAISLLARTLMRTFSDPEGGTIEYRPEHYDNTIMTTFYHYIQSPPPVIAHHKATASNSSYKKSTIYEFPIRIKAWATSDPDTMDTIFTDELIDHQYDDNEDNTITVLSSSIKGDGAYPVFRIGSEGITDFDFIMIGLRSSNTFDGGYMGTNKQEDNTDFTTGVSASYTFGEHYTTSNATGYIQWHKNANIDRVRRVTPILRFSARNLEGDINFTIINHSDGFIDLSDPPEISIGGDGIVYVEKKVGQGQSDATDGKTLLVFPTGRWPSSPLPSIEAGVDPSDQPSDPTNLFLWFAEEFWTVIAERDNPHADGLYVDSITLVPSDFIAEFGKKGDRIGGITNAKLGINSYENTFATTEWDNKTGSSTPGPRQTILKRGDSLLKMFLSKSTNHYFQFIPSDETANPTTGHINKILSTERVRIDLDLLHVTIYPFDTA